MKPFLFGGAVPSEVVLCVFRESFLSTLDEDGLSVCRSFAKQIAERALQNSNDSEKNGASSTVAEFSSGTMDIEFLAALFRNISMEGERRTLTQTEAHLSQLALAPALILEVMARVLGYWLHEVTRDLPSEPFDGSPEHGE